MERRSGPRCANPEELRKNELVKITAQSESALSAPRGTTRHRVLKYVADHGWTTSGRLASEFGLTPAAVRRHLTSLEHSGMLVVRGQSASSRHGAGRPALEYAATAAGQEEVSHSYHTLAIEAVEALNLIGGEAAVTAFFEARFAAVTVRFNELLGLDPGLTEAEALSQALTEDGYVAGLFPVGRGEQLCQHNCPYPAVAQRFPELCSVETSVFARLLHSHVQRLATIAHGDGVCTTHIPGHLPGQDRKEDR